MCSFSQIRLFSILLLLTHSLAIVLQPPELPSPVNVSIISNDTLNADGWRTKCVVVPRPPFSLIRQDCRYAVYNWFRYLPDPITEGKKDFQWTHDFDDERPHTLLFPRAAEYGSCRLVVDYKYSKLDIGKIPPFDVTDFRRYANKLATECVEDVGEVNAFVDGGRGYWNPPFQPHLTVKFTLESTIFATNNGTSISRRGSRTL